MNILPSLYGLLFRGAGLFKLPGFYILFFLLCAAIPVFAFLPDTDDDPNQKMVFTDREKEYLKKKKKITMCIDPDWMPFEANVDGVHKGMTADYFKLFEAAIGIPIEMVPTESWSQSLEMGKQRTCDIFSFVMETPERKKFFDFTRPYFRTPLVIATQLDYHWFSDISEILDRKVGIVKDYAYGEILRREYPKLKLVHVNSVVEGLYKVETGEIFGFVDTLASVAYYIQEAYFGELKISGKFNEFWELGVGTRNDEPILKDIFNSLIDSVPPKFHRNIHNKWAVANMDGKKSNKMTRAEKNFIQRHPVIRFRIRRDKPPFEFVRKGKAAGIAVDYITAIAKKAGFKPAFIINDMPLKKAYETMAGDRKEFDTLLFSVKSRERARRYAYGTPYLSYPMMIIGHTDSPYIGKTSDLKNKKVAVEESFLTIEWLGRDYPDIILIEAKNTKAALELVNDKKVDAYVGNIAVANYMMTHRNMRNLKLLAPSDYGNVEYSFVGPKEWPELVSILDKGYASLPRNFHSHIQQKWFSVQIVENIDYQLLWKIAGIITLVTLWVVWWTRKLVVQKAKTEKALSQLQEVQLLLKEQNDKLERLSVTDCLTTLNNRLKLDIVISEEFERSKRYGIRFGIIMADIDHFKKINDTYGHQTGDQVLISFAGLIRTNVRKVDTVGRWGGEEFLVICPATDQNGLIRVAENLRQIIAGHEFEGVGNITASFGAALYENDRYIKHLISRVDEALYLSKEGGRNRITFKASEH